MGFMVSKFITQAAFDEQRLVPLGMFTAGTPSPSGLELSAQISLLSFLPGSEGSLSYPGTGSHGWSSVGGTAGTTWLLHHFTEKMGTQRDPRDKCDLPVVTHQTDVSASI